MRIFKIIGCIVGLAIIRPINTSACTSAIVSADATLNKRPILWKHRDTSAIDNKVEYVVPDSGFRYVALFNASDKELKEAWIGMNERGFAVMNTASYNLKNDSIPDSQMDREGYIMTEALKKCSTVDEFDALLKNLPKPLGVEANFGVIDALGNGAFFETDNFNFIRYNLSEADNGVLVRTNYSHSGDSRRGLGQMRERNACHFIEPIAEQHAITPEFLTEHVSRTFYHNGRDEDMASSGKTWISDIDYIPRYKSTATVAIEGCRPVSDLSQIDSDFIERQYIMWTGLGYPPVADIYAVRCCQDGVNTDLKGIGQQGHSMASDKAKNLRNQVFTNTGRGKTPWVNIARLCDGQKGIVPLIVHRNLETYKKEKRQRDGGEQNF